MPKIINFENIWKTEACGQTVLPDRTKIGGNCQNSNIHMGRFESFSNNVYSYFIQTISVFRWKFDKTRRVSESDELYEEKSFSKRARAMRVSAAFSFRTSKVE